MAIKSFKGSGAIGGVVKWKADTFAEAQTIAPRVEKGEFVLVGTDGLAVKGIDGTMVKLYANVITVPEETTTIYVAPSASVNGNGSIISPFNNFTDAATLRNVDLVAYSNVTVKVLGLVADQTTISGFLQETTFDFSEVPAFVSGKNFDILINECQYPNIRGANGSIVRKFAFDVTNNTETIYGIGIMNCTYVDLVYAGSAIDAAAELYVRNSEMNYLDANEFKITELHNSYVRDMIAPTAASAELGVYGSSIRLNTGPTLAIFDADNAKLIVDAGVFDVTGTANSRNTTFAGPGTYDFTGTTGTKIAGTDMV